MTGKRLLVRSNNAAASSGNCLRRLRCSSCRQLQSALGRAEALRSGFGFARTSAGWCALDHGKDSILVRDRLSLVTDHGHEARVGNARLCSWPPDSCAGRGPEPSSASDRNLSLPCAALPNSLRFLSSPRAMVIPSLFIFTAALLRLTARRAATIEPTYRN
jgi:hypothetical protein